MMAVNNILFLVSLIVFVGYLAEWMFRKTNVPDTLLLIVVGFLIGPNVFNFIDPASLGAIAPLFTTFTLLFLMFDGSLSIDLRSFAEGIGSGIFIGFTNFFASALMIGAIFFFLGNDPMISLMLGFALGGVSSAFIIPVLKQIKVEKKLYSVLTLESALTDVLSIVLAITMMELIRLNTIDFQNIFSQVASLFFVAGVLGILAGFLWIFIESRKIIEEDRNYMMTIAYVVLVYFLTEYLGGNGAIAAMAFGMTIANSKFVIAVGQKLKKPKASDATAEVKATNVVSRRERMFYEEIAFFLKTFFFVYIGMLLNIEKWKPVLMGLAISVAVLLLRNMNALLARKYKPIDRMLINALFARGIAPAAIILMAVDKQLLTDPMLVDAVYFIITATIIFSSVRIFLYKRQRDK